MKPKNWSIRALATETGLSRREVSAIIQEQDVPPTGKLHGSRTYLLRDFLAAWRSDIEARFRPADDFDLSVLLQTALDQAPDE